MDVLILFVLDHYYNGSNFVLTENKLNDVRERSQVRFECCIIMTSFKSLEPCVHHSVLHNSCHLRKSKGIVHHISREFVVSVYFNSKEIAKENKKVCHG